MRKFWIAVLLLIFLVGIGLAYNMKKADKLFDAGTFQEALTEYEEVFKKSTDEETRWKAFFRICESLTHLFRYGDASQKIISTPLPKKMPHRGRVLILKAGMLRNYLMQYSSIQRKDVIEDAEKDIYKLTPSEIGDEISKTYQELWKLRKELLSQDLNKESYYLEIKDVDFGMYPTLYDYVILSWTDFLIEMGRDSNVQEEAEPLLVSDLKLKVNFNDPPALLAAELMEEASRMGKPEASERWKIRRLLLPLKTGAFEVKDHKTYRNKAKDILLKWMVQFKTRVARAEAGYEAALIYEQNEEYVSAVKLCKEIEKKYSGTYQSQLADILRLRIERPSLSLKAKTVMPPGKGAFDITTRNLKKAYFRVYQIDPRKLKGNIRYYGWSNLLRSPAENWLKEYLPSAKPYKEWSIQIPDNGDHKFYDDTKDPPELDIGFYLVLFSDDKSFTLRQDRVKASFLNVTDLVLLGTAGCTKRTRDAYYSLIEKGWPSKVNDDCFHFYALDAKTGKPVSGADVNVYLGHPLNRFKDLRTDNIGSASLDLSLKVYPNNYNRYSADPLAEHKDSFAFWRYALRFYYSEESPIVLFLENDRPIYRPGDKVMAKVIALRETSQGYRTVAKGRNVNFKAYDPNYKEFFSKTVKVGDFGSADIEFVVPKGRLLGGYSLSADLQDGRFKGGANLYFSVEEYKRPEFEITLKKADKPWKYEKQVKISGSAKYYFGGAVPLAPVAYRIMRQTYIPWYYRFWFTDGFFGRDEEVASGQLKTDSDGNFSFDFTPTPPSKKNIWKDVPDITSFIVEVEGRDSGGRTISAQETYRAGKKALYFTIEPKKGFYFEKESIEIGSKLLTVNDTPASGESSYKVYSLAKTKAASLEVDQGGRWRSIPPLDVQLRDVPNDKLITQGKLKHDKDGKALIKISALSQGTYRIVQKTKDEWGEEVEQTKIIVVAKRDAAVPISAASVTIVEKDEYEVGDTARFIIGSGLADGIYNVELWAGRHLLKKELIDSRHPVRLIEIPITKDMKGGFSLRWFGVKDLEVYQGSATVSVPWTEKKLSVSLEPFSKELKPGAKAEWGVKINDAQVRPEQGEVLALMYDRSLEYYVETKNIWLDGLYRLRTSPTYWSDSVFDPYVMDLSGYVSLPKVIAPKLPGLRTRGTWVRAAGYIAQPSMMMMKEEAVDLEADMAAAPAPPVPEGRGAAEVEAKKIEARKEFADTAFFKPHILTGRDGRQKFSFTAPEQLTSWKIKLFAFTKDAKEGTLTEDAVTKKDLMVRADIPRFFREKDKGTVTAIVHNETEKDLEGELFIEIKENDKSIHEKIKLTDAKKKFNIKPHGLQSFDWMISVPDGLGTYKVRVAAVSGKLSDAEERELPILPSRQRLIESAFIALSGSESKKLEIPPKKDPTRINESMVLQIDPQLALSIINSMPFLVEYPYACVEQLLNRYVPLSIVNEVYNKYPDLRKAAAKVPKRKTISPAWEKEDPRRLTTLMETPWVWQSEGRPTKYPIIDLLDPKIVKKQKDENLDKIISAQLSNGAFPWWPGGREDLYMTLYVLAGFAEAKRYGVEVPKDITDKAIDYVNQEIPNRLKPEERNLALISYASYVLTSYSQEVPKSWIDLLEKHIYALTPLGKAYLAFTHLRMGNKKRAGEVLDMAMDGSREDPIAGVYWTPEKYSWVWYSDSVEKHAFFLRTLQELRPEDKKIPGMVKWLLFNRKGTVWKSTKASAAAVYALLDFMNQSGALASDENFSVAWGKDTYSAVVKADDWLDKPIRWQKTGFDITENDQTAVVTKEGKGMAFASLTWTYSTDQLPEASQPGMLELNRKFYRRVKQGDDYHLKPLEPGDKVSVGDQIEVQLKINTRSQFEYMHLKDLKAAGFEAETLLSGWRYDPLWYYEEPRDSLTNFFVSWLPHGEYILRYKLRPTKPGTYRIGSATLQSMYSPEMTAHSAGFIIRVE